MIFFSAFLFTMVIMSYWLGYLQGEVESVRRLINEDQVKDAINDVVIDRELERRLKEDD